MNIPPVTFIAYEEFDNLGIGYIASVLTDAGYEISVIDFREGKKEILKKVQKLKPLIIGISVIFQYHINEFEELIRYLREAGIKCHFSAGGQYASLRCEELFGIIPSLDSIVRFDGEYTFRELVQCIYNGTDWKKVSGLAYHSSNKLIVNPLRPVEKNLDNYPLPMRSPLKEYAYGEKFATILAGRGCVNNCLFCSVREYYHQSSGPYKRIRKPDKVVEEMELLHLLKDCSVFLFQDDDFPVKTQKGTGWIKNFCKGLRQKSLADNIIWKINCRPDEIEHESFTMMKKHGLYLVFIGIEDGTDTGLSRLNKHITTGRILEGVNILKDLGIGFDYGFMPFQPESTFESVRNNFTFLREICSDGYAPVTFMKMMPFAATPVEEILRKERRLKGNPGFLDYDFHDESLNNYYEFVNDCLITWLRDTEGLLNISKWARNYISVCSRFFGETSPLSKIKTEVTMIISESNIFLLDILDELSVIFESGKYKSKNFRNLDIFRRRIRIKHNFFLKRLKKCLTNLLIIGEFQKQTKAFLSVHL